jgi:hypothetical protein
MADEQAWLEYRELTTVSVRLMSWATAHEFLGNRAGLIKRGR